MCGQIPKNVLKKKKKKMMKSKGTGDSHIYIPKPSGVEPCHKRSIPDDRTRAKEGSRVLWSMIGWKSSSMRKLPS